MLILSKECQTGKVKFSASEGEGAVDFAVTEAKSNQMLLSMLVSPTFIQGVCRESYNTGLISVTGRPSRDLWEEMAKANLSLLGNLIR